VGSVYLNSPPARVVCIVASVLATAEQLKSFWVWMIRVR
jgi:hypothetical protein